MVYSFCGSEKVTKYYTLYVYHELKHTARLDLSSFP